MKEVDKIIYSPKVGKSYKNHGWSVSRELSLDIIPKISYEDECDIIVDGIKSKAHLNIQPRIFYNKDEVELIQHLKKLADKDSDDKVNIELLLNHENDIKHKIKKFDESQIEINQLKYLNGQKKIELDNLQNYCNFLKKENGELHKEVLLLKQENKSLIQKLHMLSDLINETL